MTNKFFNIGITIFTCLTRLTEKEFLTNINFENCFQIRNQIAAAHAPLNLCLNFYNQNQCIFIVTLCSTIPIICKKCVHFLTITVSLGCLVFNIQANIIYIIPTHKFRTPQNIKKIRITMRKQHYCSSLCRQQLCLSLTFY